LQSEIDVCAEYGETYGIQFNPDKTVVIIFNFNVTRTAEQIIADQWQGNTLNGKPIEVVTSNESELSSHSPNYESSAISNLY
jgi:hypothetical protein